MRTDSTWRAVEHDSRVERGLGASLWEWLRAQASRDATAAAVHLDALVDLYADAHTYADADAHATADAYAYAHDADAYARAYAHGRARAVADAEVEP